MATLGVHMSRRTFAYTFLGKPEEFLGHVQESPVLVASFSAKWCRPCHDIQPELRALAVKFGAAVAEEGDVASHVAGESVKQTMISPAIVSSLSSSTSSSASPSTEVRFFDIDITANESLAALHDIRCVPTFCVYLNGELFGTIEGASVSRLDTMISEAVKENGAASPPPPPQQSQTGKGTSPPLPSPADTPLQPTTVPTV